ncbi:MAG: hypothetical protein CVT82_13680 [Alphaproteobacteria bacterium HGW-Alphaproteobacteria-4]|jgi:hypothetical protein|nr:MAG: hypothetical protein CVT82_13680 [Alphaproteobacteria bacterium HGW-Alphaproteobacteria-4]
MIGQLMPILPPHDILREVTLLAAVTSTAATIVMPAGVRAGDLALLFDAPAGGNSPRVIPAGFTSLYAIATTGGWGRHHGVAMRVIASAAEGGTTLTGSAGTVDPGTGIVNSRKILLVFRGNVPFKTATYVPGVSGGTNGNPGTITLASGVGTPPLILWGCISTTAHATTPFEAPWTTPAFGAEVFVEALRVGFTIVNRGGVPANQALDMTDFGSSNMLTAAYVTLEG